MKSFGSKELEKCLKALGFRYDGVSSSHHAKYYAPNGTEGLAYPFFLFQLGIKSYPKHSANRYITQLKRFGYTKEDIEKLLVK